MKRLLARSPARGGVTTVTELFLFILRHTKVHTSRFAVKCVDISAYLSINMCLIFCPVYIYIYVCMDIIYIYIYFIHARAS
jgi:hypothetical protein